MFPGFDPSKMDPKVLMELSQLVQGLPPDKLNQMQTLMHNMMAGHDVRAQMEEFERNLPPDFRMKIASLMGTQLGTGAFGGMPPAHQVMSPLSQPVSSVIDGPAPEMDMREARMTVLRGVASGSISPEEAEQILFPQG